MEISDIRWEGQLNRHNPEESKLTLRLPSGSYIYKKWKWKSGYLTAWGDGRIFQPFYQLFLNEEEYNKVREAYGGVSWDKGIHFYGGYYIYIHNDWNTAEETFIRVMKLIL